MKDELKKYNASQKEAICHGDGPALVLAGPGSGKTTVITKRLQYLITTLHILPQEILVVTFTKAAAMEMQQRFDRLMGERLPVCFGTFHSIFYRILQEHHKKESLTILTEKEKAAFMGQILRREQLAEDFIPAFLECFAQIKNNPSSVQIGLPENISQEHFRHIFDCYRKKCKENSKLDFDDMAYECLQLFQRRPDILKKWQERFVYILVDEYQDIAPIQEQVLSLLAMPENNIFAVGDDDQTIYGFRGANTESMLSFPKKYADARLVLLEMNYRSRPEIVRAAQAVIAKNKKRFRKQQKAARESLSAESISSMGFETQAEENKAIIERLGEYERLGQLEQCAVLYRKNKDAGRLIRLLEKEKMPYSCTEKKMRLQNHFITEDITAYLRLLEGDRTRKNFYKIMNRPDRGLDRELFREEKLCFFEEKSMQKLKEDCKRAEKLSLFARLMYIRKGFGYEDWLLNRKTNDEAEREEYKEILQELQEKAKQLSGMKEWEMWLQEKANDDSRQSDGKNTGLGKGVRILTYHACKGLEFDCVILPDLNEGIVPHKKAVKEAELEEERRMFYVAMTRAKEKLFLFYLTGTKEEPETMSRFLNYSSSSTSSSNSALSRYSSNASATISYSSSSSI